jgi:hypothetical protein
MSDQMPVPGQFVGLLSDLSEQYKIHPYILHYAKVADYIQSFGNPRLSYTNPPLLIG